MTSAGYGQLAGLVNIAWDGGVHAFIVGTLVAASARHANIGTALVAAASPPPAPD